MWALPARSALTRDPALFRLQLRLHCETSRLGRQTFGVRGVFIYIDMWQAQMLLVGPTSTSSRKFLPVILRT